MAHPGPLQHSKKLYVRMDEESEKAKNPAAAKDQDQTDKLPEDDLLSSEWVRRWALVAPALMDEDLRPYLFVSRDRKALFTAGSNLALKEDWIEKLCGSTLGARAAAVES